MTQQQPAVPSSSNRIRAPRDHGELAAVPDLREAGEIAEANAIALSRSNVELAGRSLGEFRRWSREVMLRSAGEWTESRLGIGDPQVGEGPLFVTGHQPEFVHPGVWMKNMATTRLAARSGGTGLNLIVDNDTLDSCSIRVPGGPAEEPRFEAVPFDDETTQIPWEELRVRNPELFSTFASRIGEALAAWGIEPVLSQVWPAAVARMQHPDGTCVPLTAARAALERKVGPGNWELPVSRLCRTEPFLLFVHELARRHEELFVGYNTAVETYRREHRIRNNRHPVPNLVRTGSAFEIPFWYWRAGESARHRVFAERIGSVIALSADGRELCRFDSTQSAIEELHEVQDQGRLRTRALTTTLFSRLCLADLFIHGIGGAKYDAVTDRIIADLFGIAAPRFLTLTATWHLPLGGPRIAADDVSRAARQVRDMRFHPERYVDNLEMRRLAEMKGRLIRERSNARAAAETKRERRKQRAEARRIHRELKSIHEQMASLAVPEALRAVELLQEQHRLVRAAAVLRSREFPVVLFPEPDIWRMRDSLDAALT